MYEDTSKELGASGRFWTEVSYDGHASSEVPDVFKHWHKHHDEWVEVLSGRVSIFRNGTWTTMTPQTGKLLVPRRTVHAFNFFKGEKAVARESTQPSGDFKHFFFRDMFAGGQVSFLRAIRACYDGDTCVALPLGIFFVDEIFTNVFGWIATLLYPRAPELGSGIPPKNQSVGMKQD